MKKQKEIPTLTGFIIIIIATVILFGGAFAYQNSAIQQIETLLQIQEIKQTKTASQASGWKTYKSDKYGFKFQYPSNFSPTSWYDYGNGTAYVGGIYFWQNKQSRIALDINIEPFSGKLENKVNSLKTLWAGPAGNGLNNKVSDTTDKKTVAGNTALEFENVVVDKKGNLAVDSFYTYLLKNNTLWSFEFSEYIKIDQRDTDMYHQILSTFQFIK